MTKILKPIYQLKKCYQIGKQLSDSTYNYCNFQNILDQMSKTSTLEDLLEKMNDLEKVCIQNSKKKEIIENNGTLLGKIAFTFGMRSDSKKFQYVEMGKKYWQQF